MADPTVDDARRELRRARDALQDARILYEAGGTDAGVCNRLYYAAFHAAQAVLYARGENPSSHGHVRRQFGQHVVLTGDATREEGRLLSSLYDYRQKADYGRGVSDVNVEGLIDDVGEFVEHMSALVAGNSSA